jgi:hypothetical protein
MGVKTYLFFKTGLFVLLRESEDGPGDEHPRYK